MYVRMEKQHQKLLHLSSVYIIPHISYEVCVCAYMCELHTCWGGGHVSDV